MCLLVNTPYPQECKNGLQYQDRSECKRRSLRDVRQDNIAPMRDRIGTSQPYRADQVMRSHPLSINSDRSQKKSTSRRTLPATGWVDRPIGEEIDRIAKREGLTRSRTIRNLLHWVVNQELHQQTAALIPEGHERRINDLEDKAGTPHPDENWLTTVPAFRAFGRIALRALAGAGPHYELAFMKC